jgi:hypothetical protein
MEDGNALREVFGTSLRDHELGVPQLPRQVEQIADPKHTLSAAWQAVRRHTRRGEVGRKLEALGERVSLDTLRAVPSFRALEEEVVDRLSNLGYLTP